MLAYTIIRSRRSSVALEVTKQGTLLVRAPLHLSERAIADFVNAHAGWAEAHLRRRAEELAAAPPPLTEAEIQSLIQRAKAVLPEKVSHYAARLGVTPAGLRITRARTRYGSCSAANRLSFSCFLMDCPEEAIDLVVVHELCHIRHHDHSPAFYALLESILPDHRVRKKLLHMRG